MSKRGTEKGKSPKYNFQDDGHISSGQALHFIYRKFTLKKPELPHQVWSHGGSTLKKRRSDKYGHIALWVLEQKAGQVLPL